MRLESSHWNVRSDRTDSGIAYAVLCSKNKCGGAMQQVQNVLQQELGGFQNKLQGCMRRCQEAAQVRERCLWRVS